MSSLTQDSLLKEVISKQRFDFLAYRQEGNEICQIICKELSKHLGLDRWLIAGSIGKRTWLGKDERPDFDVVPLLNRSEGGKPGLSADQVITIIVNVVKSLPWPFRYIAHSSFTVQCSYRQFEFDIVPGFNFVTNTGEDPHHGLTQLDRTWKNIVENGGDIKRPFISASLAEYVVPFVGDQEEFVHDIIKLAKLWVIRNIDESAVGEIKGRSFTMELIAIHVATKEGQRYYNPKSWARAFEEFLQVFLLSKTQVSIFFAFKGSKSQEKAYEQYLKMTRSGGVILDPANPWNNLLDNFTNAQWRAFSIAARQSLALIARRDAAILHCFQ